MKKADFANWVSTHLIEHHKAQAKYESDSKEVNKYFFADNMTTLLSNAHTEKAWKKIQKELIKTPNARSDDQAVYDLVISGLYAAKKLANERLRMNESEKQEHIKNIVYHLKELKRGLARFGHGELVSTSFESRVLKTLDMAERFNQLGRQNNKNTDRDMCCYFLVSAFASRFMPRNGVRRPCISESATIVSILFDCPSFDAKAATKACDKIEKAFTCRPLVEGIDFINPFANGDKT